MLEINSLNVSKSIVFFNEIPKPSGRSIDSKAFKELLHAHIRNGFINKMLPYNVLALVLLRKTFLSHLSIFQE